MRWLYCLEVRLPFMATNKLLLQLALAFFFCPNEERDLGSLEDMSAEERKWGKCGTVVLWHLSFIFGS